MRIEFHGDRASKTIAFGKWVKKHVQFIPVAIMLWDGYRSQIIINKEAA